MCFVASVVLAVLCTTGDAIPNPSGSSNILPALAAESSYNFLNNTDFAGQSCQGCKAYSDPVKTASDCGDLCKAIPHCVAVTWNGPQSQYKNLCCNFKCSSDVRVSNKGSVGMIVRPGPGTCALPPGPTTPTPAPPTPTPAPGFAANENNIMGAIPNPSGTSKINLVGVFAAANACELAASKRKNATSWTYHHCDLPPAASGNYSCHCYARTDGIWAPVPQKLVDSGFIRPVAPTPGPTPFICADAMDCSLNGECSAAGTCNCDSGWRGTYCSILDLLPVDRAKFGLRLENGTTPTSSWGGTPVLGADGRYHLMAEVMANGCGIESWANNSFIGHATSDTLAGPYALSEPSMLLKPFHHNVGAARLPGGSEPNDNNDTWLIFSTGCDVWPDTLRTCTSPSPPQQPPPQQQPSRPPMPPGCSDLTPTPPWMPYKSLCLDGRIRLSVSRSGQPAGPYETLPHPVLQPQYDGWDPFVTNAAPLLLPNGSVLLVYRGFNVSGTDAIGMAFAEHWRGPYTRISADGPLFTDHAEDGFVYKGRRGYHIVMHHLPPSQQQPASFPFDPQVWSCGYACIGHAYARSPWGPWKYSPEPAASNNVAFTDGTSVPMLRRERPQVITDAEGNVLALFTGVQPPSAAAVSATPAEEGGGSMSSGTARRGGGGGRREKAGCTKRRGSHFHVGPARADGYGWRRCCGCGCGCGCGFRCGCRRRRRSWCERRS